ncbi:hypothetical protein FNW25_10425 [Flavobacterium franklandianum]|uniref:Adenylosuccinate lyase n=1 Tax=Flavobacterium franklandianum TaxID=2594430 RepID=A0A553CQX3_9FLAO|nr:hypothetical protein [Flavobacterium franklandianum]TRX22899.1 hypothetical protein FNW17_03800 [Flavobacterium franklandianum]TRX24955.1 hypothetical protein FNW25_10425 [Flavobacterium franklandianum]
MSTDFQKKIDSVTGYKSNRHKYANELLENPELFPELIQLCFLTSNNNAAKACWILELICYDKLEWLQEHLDCFCTNIKNATDKSAIRALSKICMLLAISHFKKKEIQLTENQLRQITESCFDWLIGDAKVASKCYSIRTLHLLGHHFDWIHPELKVILDKDYTNHSAAYKAVGREILKKINKQK